MQCPPDEVVRRFVDNTAPEPERQAFGEHLGECANCLSRVTTLSVKREAPSDTDDLGGRTPAPPPARVLTRGTVVGRYVVLDLLGKGGMGEVYTAFDPELDRKVAVKIVKSDASYGEQQNETRLFREAQAMAKLAHPNVVPVYDVGLVEDRVFLAMELVSGTTVKLWTSRASRSWREVLRVYREAGEGLSAAHKVGLVHRDFKPDNVLIGDDGRVRVLDFGLAKTDRRERATKPSDSDLHAHSLLDSNITHAASILGTPAYMAPERLSGSAEDARTDQFSFCVALYEGLYGQKPFAGDTTERIVASIMQGTIRTAPGGRAVPGWLRRIVLRGLSQDAAARYPSMEALLVDLGADVEGRRQRRGLGVVLAVVASTVVFGAWRASSERAALCRGFESHLTGIWDQAVRDSTRQVFERVGGAVGLETHHRAERIFDQWASDWLDTRTTVCEATRLRGEQPESVLALRMACLDQALVTAKAASSLFATADKADVVKAVDVVATLPRLDGCANTAKLLLAAPPSSDPVVVKQVEEVRALVADALVSQSAGKFERARTLSETALKRAQELKHRALAADAAYALARAIERLGDAKLAFERYHVALTLAFEAGNDELLARAAAKVAYTGGYLLNQGDEAQRWLAVAMSSLERAGHPEVEEAEVLDLAGIVEVAGGRVESARQFIEKAVALRKHALGEKHLDTARAMGHLAFMLSLLGKADEALAMQNAVLEINTTVLGENHPDLGEVLIGIGTTHYRADRLEEALKAFRQALVVLEGALGPDHADVLIALNNVGAALAGLQRYAEALPYQRRALAMKEKLLGPDHPDVGIILGNMGESLGRLGQHEEALAAVQRALAIVEKANGPNHPNTVTVLRQLGEAHISAKRPREAAVAFERALKASTQTDIEPRTLANLQVRYVRLLVDLGEHARARVAFDGYRKGIEAAGLNDDSAAIDRALARR